MTQRSVDSFTAWADDAALILESAAATAVGAGDSARAVGLAWSADLARLQGQLWAQLIGVQQLSRREYFHVLQELVTGLGEAPDDVADAAEYLDAARTRLLLGVSEFLPDGLILSLIPGLTSLSAPSAADWADLRAALLSDVDPEALVQARRRQSADLMLRALRAQQAGDDAEAIRLAYDSDMSALEAYLVESARAVDDPGLITVAARWALVSARMGRLAALPSDFASAVRTVRMVLAEALGDADGARMLAGLQPFSS